MDGVAKRETPVSLGGAALRWARDSFRSRGVWKSARYLGEQFWLLARDSMPDRRRSRFGDIDYDCDYGVDTTWARLPMRVRLREVFTERLYQPTVPDEFGEIMQHLASVDFTSFTFIDLGSGKGRALLMAAMYPFAEVIGVEVQAELHAIAEQNIYCMEQNGRQCHNIRSVCMDGRDFQFPDTPLLLYLFNPFPDYVMRIVLENLRRSLQAHPRPTWFVYNAPFEKHVVEEFAYLRPYTETPQYTIYKAEVDG